MSVKFPEPEWVDAMVEKLNTDEKYAQVASNWEGDFIYDIEADDMLPERVRIYMDLWHGKCRQAYILEPSSDQGSAFVLQAPYKDFIRVLKGELHPMQAMMTRKLKVKGSMAYMMRNVPTVLEFVRCAQEVTSNIEGE